MAAAGACPSPPATAAGACNLAVELEYARDGAAPTHIYLLPAVDGAHTICTGDRRGVASPWHGAWVYAPPPLELRLHFAGRAQRLRDMSLVGDGPGHFVGYDYRRRHVVLTPLRR